jgi:hypothetical protein
MGLSTEPCRPADADDLKRFDPSYARHAASSATFGAWWGLSLHKLQKEPSVTAAIVIGKNLGKRGPGGGPSFQQLRTTACTASTFLCVEKHYSEGMLATCQLHAGRPGTDDPDLYVTINVPLEFLTTTAMFGSWQTDAESHLAALSVTQLKLVWTWDAARGLHGRVDGPPSHLFDVTAIQSKKKSATVAHSTPLVPAPSSSGTASTPAATTGSSPTPASSGSSGRTLATMTMRQLEDLALAAMSAGQELDDDHLEAIASFFVTDRSDDHEADDFTDWLGKLTSESGEDVRDQHDRAVMSKGVRTHTATSTLDELSKKVHCRSDTIAAGNDMVPDERLDESLLEEILLGEPGDTFTPAPVTIDVAASMATWMSQASRSHTVLKDRQEHLTSGAGLGGTYPYQLSLVVFEGEVQLVHWSNPTAYKGRACRVDYSVDGSTAYAVYPVKHLSDFAACEVIHPALGVHCVRSRDRTELPPKCLRLTAMWEAVLSNGAGAASLIECSGCHQPITATGGAHSGTAPSQSAQPHTSPSGGASVAGIGAASGDFTCCVCCQSWHEGCISCLIASDACSTAISQLPDMSTVRVPPGHDTCRIESASVAYTLPCAALVHIALHRRCSIA